MDAFENLEVWKKGCRVAVRLYRQLVGSKEWGFRDQICRSALSIPSNIAEGYERSGRKEYIQFLRIAKGSCGELRTQLYIGKSAGLIDADLATELIEETHEISRMLGAMIARIGKREDSISHLVPRP
jgi:four helix bundle protein